MLIRSKRTQRHNAILFGASILCSLFGSLTAQADSCSITVYDSCNFSVPLGRAFADDGYGAASNQTRCLWRATDYQLWCGGSGRVQANYTSSAASSTVLVTRSGVQGLVLSSSPRGSSALAFVSNYNPENSLRMQSDGNLVLTRNGVVLWHSGTSGRTCAGGCTAMLQSDGNLVLSEGGTPYWSTQTYSKPDRPYAAQSLRLTDDAPNFRLAAANGAVVWSTCLSGGDENTIQNILNTGAGARATLCNNSQFNLNKPIMFTADDQEISTEGYPTDSRRAKLVLWDTHDSNAINSYRGSFSRIRIRNIAVDGLRRWSNGQARSALIDIGSYAANEARGQQVDWVQAYEARGWSHLHVNGGVFRDQSGRVDRPCSAASITNNDIGYLQSMVYQPGQSFTTDGISLACAASYVGSNHVTDVTDGGIVIFGAPGSIIEGNTIQTLRWTMYGAIAMVDQVSYQGNFSSTQVRYNMINAAGGHIRVGIAVGTPVWFGTTNPECKDLNGNIQSCESMHVYGGQVYGNVLASNGPSGGGTIGYGIAVRAVDGFYIDNNTSYARYAGDQGSDTNAVRNPAAVAFIANPGDSQVNCPNQCGVQHNFTMSYFGGVNNGLQAP